MKGRQCLIVGCGDVGSRVGRLLRSAGAEIVATRRSVEELPKDFTTQALDVAEPLSWQKLSCKPDYVVYSVAAGGRDEQSYRRAYLDGMQNLLNWLKFNNHQPRLILFTSSTSVYGQNQHEWIDETSVTVPPNFAGRIMLEAENALRESGFAHCCVRLSGIYGPGREYLLNQVRAGVIADREPQIYTNRIHVDDAAGAIVHLLDRAEGRLPVEPVVVLSDNQPVTRYELTSWLAQLLGVGVSDGVSAGNGNIIRMVSSKRCSNRVLRESGFALQYPSFREGYGMIIQGSQAPE